MSAGERRLDPARGYRIFDRLLDRVARRVLERAPRLGACSSAAVGQRLLQRVVELAAYPCVAAAAEAHARGADPEAVATTTVQLGGLRFREDTVSVTPATWVRGLVDFFGQWARVLWWLAAWRGAAGAIPSQATLVLGIGPSDLAVEGSDQRFAAFCRDGPLPPLREATHLVVESATALASSHAERLTYARHPLLALLNAQPPRGLELVRLLFEHLRAAAVFIQHCFTRPLVCLLARDMALHAPARDLDRRRMIEAILITNSYFQAQPLWMRAPTERRFKVHMAWYSQNTVPFVFKADGMRAELPHYRLMAVDIHWVWTPGFAAYLRELVRGGVVEAVGSILWYLPEKAVPAAAPAPQIAIFDVTPVRESYAAEIGLPRNYYSTGNMIAFVTQALSACERAAAQTGQRVAVVLKHKRGYAQLHDPRYIEFVDGLVRTGRLSLAAAHTNLYSLIGASAAIVVVPFSSPAYIASALNVPAIYLDPSAAIEPTHERAAFVDFVADEARLAARLRAAIEAGERRERHA